MRGIDGVFNGQTAQDVEQILPKISQCELDGQGKIIYPLASCVHTGLAIIDVEGGYQPMRLQGYWDCSYMRNITEDSIRIKEGRSIALP